MFRICKLILGFSILLSANLWAKEEQSTHKENLYETFGSKYKNISIKKIAWDANETHELLDEFLRAYTHLYLEFPKAFRPYKVRAKMNLNFLWEHLCEKDFPYCHDKYLKEKVKNIYKEQRDLYQIDTKIKTKKDLNSKVKTLSKKAERLKTFYKTYRDHYLDSLGKIAKEEKNLKNIEQFNLAMTQSQNLRSEDFDSYREEYLKQTQTYPEKLLLSPRLLKLIEGQNQKLESNDVIYAIEALTKELKRRFHFDLHLIIASLPKEQQSRYFKKTPPNYDGLNGGPIDYEYYHFWSGVSDQSKKMFGKTSTIQEKRIDTPLILNLIKKFHSEDGETIDFLLAKNYQRTVWRLRDIEDKKADALSKIIKEDLLSEDKVVSVKKLGGGAGTTYVVSFQDSLRCVYKPMKTEKMLDQLITNSHYEIAASVVDELLDLRSVPITVEKTFAPYEKGSCQYFAEDTFQAIEVMKYGRIEPMKFSRADGKATKTRDTKFFDRFIDNHDRNIHNYLYSHDGRLFLIDHGYSFHRYFKRPFITHTIKNNIPSERVYERLVKLDKNPQILKEALEPWIPKMKIKNLQKKVKNTVKYIQKKKIYGNPS